MTHNVDMIGTDLDRSWEMTEHPGPVLYIIKGRPETVKGYERPKTTEEALKLGRYRVNVA
jgi:hypothetical protein